MNRLYLFLSVAILALATLSLTHASTIQVDKLATSSDFAPRKDFWLARTSRSFTYKLNDGTTQTFQSPSFIAFGGLESDYSSNDVWISTDAKNWQMIGGRTNSVNSSNPDKTYIFHVGQAECQDFVNDRLYITGGEIGQLTLQSGYVSQDGGATWTEFTMGDNRSYSNCLVDSESRVYVMNGILNYNRQGPGSEKRQPNNEVWTSTNMGRSWTQLRNATYAQRMAASVAISINKGPKEDTDIIYVVGGLTLNEDGTERGLNDVWVSTTHAQSWIRVTDAAQFPHHIDTTLIVSQQGLLLLIGGRNEAWGESNIIWGSMDGGKNWGQLTPNNGYTGRIFPAAIFDTNGYLYVIGGEYNGRLLSDAYKTTISLEDDLPRTALLLELNANVWDPARLCLGFLPCAAPLETARIGTGPFAPRGHMGAFVTRKDITVNVLDNGNFPSRTFPSGSYIMAAGYNDNSDNDVWISTDGVTWSLVGGHATINGTVYNSEKPDKSFKLYSGQTACANYDGDFLVLAGGDTDNGPTSASYTSRDAGATWTLNPPTFSFEHRAWTTCAINSNNVVFVVGGIINYDNTGGDNRTPSNDVWRSADYGRTWSRVESKAPFTPRGAQGLAMAYKQGANSNVDVIYMAGGITDVVTRDALNDVWASTDGGLNWVRTTTAAAWVKRADLSMTVSHAGVLIVSGGRTDGNDVHFDFYVFNDIWVSFDGGVNFFLVEESAFTPRRHHGIFTDLNGKFVVIGGQGGRNNPDAYLRDVYRTTVGSFDKPNTILPLLHKSDQAKVTNFNPECSGYLVLKGEACPAYLDPPSGLSTGAIAAIVILVIVVVVGIIGWAFYSIRVHGELRIPCTNKACNCCNNALKGDQLADDGFALHKGTGKLKSNLNGSLHHRLIDE